MSANQDSPCLCPTDKTRKDSCRQWLAHRNHLIYFVLRTEHLIEKTRLTRTVSLKLDLTLIYVIWTKQDKTYTDSVYQTKLTLIISYGQNKFNPHRRSWSIRTHPMSHGLTPTISTEQKPCPLLTKTRLSPTMSKGRNSPWRCLAWWSTGTSSLAWSVHSPIRPANNQNIL